MKKQLLTGIFAVGTLVVAASVQMNPAQALTFGNSSTFGFKNITNNNATNAATESQYFVDVWEIKESSNQVLFNIRNIGPNQSTISEVYFDDGSLLGIAGLIDKDQDALLGSKPVSNLDYTKVDFTQGSAVPGNLPGGTPYEFNVTSSFLANADNPAPQNGVNSGTVLGILFNLKEQQTYDSVIDAIHKAQLNQDITGALRIGIHVTNFTNGGSESFINTGQTTPIPTPALLPGLISMGIAALRKKKQEETTQNP